MTPLLCPDRPSALASSPFDVAFLSDRSAELRGTGIPSGADPDRRTASRRRTSSGMARVTWNHLPHWEPRPDRTASPKPGARRPRHRRHRPRPSRLPDQHRQSPQPRNPARVRIHSMNHQTRMFPLNQSRQGWPPDPPEPGRAHRGSHSRFPVPSHPLRTVPRDRIHRALWRCRGPTPRAGSRARRASVKVRFDRPTGRRETAEPDPSHVRNRARRLTSAKDRCHHLPLRPAVPPPKLCPLPDPTRLVRRDVVEPVREPVVRMRSNRSPPLPTRPYPGLLEPLRSLLRVPVCAKPGLPDPDETDELPTSSRSPGPLLPLPPGPVSFPVPVPVPVPRAG